MELLGAKKVVLFQEDDKEGWSEVNLSADAGVEVAASSQPRPGATSIAKQVVARHMMKVASTQEAMIKEQGLSGRRSLYSSHTSPVCPENARAAPLKR